jgi:hypothetical protein
MKCHRQQREVSYEGNAQGWRTTEKAKMWRTRRPRRPGDENGDMSLRNRKSDTGVKQEKWPKIYRVVQKSNKM